MANTGLTACSLGGFPTVVPTRKGVALPIEQRPPAENSTPSVVLGAHSSNRADLTVYWSNWCKPDPGPLQDSITLANNGGTFSVPFDGPPDYNYVPRYDAAGQPSTIEVLDLTKM